MARSMSCLLVLSGLLVCTSPAFGQSGDRRGFWFGLGVAGASTNIACARCTSERKLGIAGFIQLGGSISSRVKVGIEATGWQQSEPDSTREYAAVTGVVIFHPDPAFPVYLKGGIGAGRYAEAAGSDLMSSNGFAAHLGAGADFRLSERITVGPYIEYVFSNDQDVKLNRRLQFTPLDLNMVQFGVAARWH